MKILVLGAGAVGGYFGGRMMQAGADVTFLVRPKRAESLARDGLRIRSRFGDCTLAAKCVTQDRVAADHDVVILTSKAYDLPLAIEAIAPALGAHGRVLPFLNGMAHLEHLDRRFGRARVLGGVAYIAATLAPDGEIRHLNDIHRLVFGARDAAQQPACEALAGALAGVSFQWQLHDRIEQAMWDKWVMLASLAAITCLMRAPVGDIVASPGGERLAVAMLDECASVAKACGFETPAGTLANCRSMLTQKGSVFTASMLRDVEAGGQTEGDHVLGALLRSARQHGIGTPLLEVAVTHLEAYAARRGREGATTR